MEYYAHKTESGNLQTLEQHLNGTADLAESFAKDIFKPMAHAIGLAHDIGKYSLAFQNRLNGGREQFEHSACGAIEYKKIIEKKFGNNSVQAMFAPMLEYCIACHHTGLQDGGSIRSHSTPGTLQYRIARERASEYSGSADYSEYANNITLEIPDFTELFNHLKAAGNFIDIIELYAFFTRYLFSCLTDADFLDTERFCRPDIKRGLKADFAEISKRLEDKLSAMPSETPLQAARSRLQKQVYENAEKATSQNMLSILNMPTGSGKTLCSLKLALGKVLSEKGKKRIIYVIPYTGIIEQTASEFSELFGDAADILQHHSNYCPNSAEDDESADTDEKLKRAAENWDAPIVITTAVRFFESICDYRGSALRKLHNMADSVIVFDEIHTLPVECLQPCLRAIGYITEYLNSEAIFLSATMPDYTRLFDRYAPSCRLTHLITDKTDFGFFKKAEYIKLGSRSMEAIAEKAAEYNSSLIIVNTRKSAREMYNILDGNKYHLSTYMTPIDRRKTIEKIKANLAAGVPVTVVSTSLIEAGIDLDFEAVFRELTGLDSILQAGGRCNREGRRDKGTVYIFETEGTGGKTEQRVIATKRLLEEYNDITASECVESYYNEIFYFNQNNIDANSICKSATNPGEIKFKTFAEKFKLITDSSIGIVINRDERSEYLLSALKSGDRSVLRELQQYTVSLKYNSSEACEFSSALKQGIISDCRTGIFMLTNNQYYNEETGLDTSKSTDIIL